MQELMFWLVTGFSVGGSFLAFTKKNAILLFICCMVFFFLGASLNGEGLETFKKDQIVQIENLGADQNTTNWDINYVTLTAGNDLSVFMFGYLFYIAGFVCMAFALAGVFGVWK